MSLQEAASSGSFNPHAAQPSDAQRVESPFDPPPMDQTVDHAVDRATAELPSPFVHPYDDGVHLDEGFGEENQPDMRATRRRAWTVIGLAVLVPAAVAGVIAWQLFGSSGDPTPTVTRVTTTPAETATPVVEVTAAIPVTAAPSAETETAAATASTGATTTVAASTEASAVSAETAETVAVVAEPAVDLSSLEPAERLAAWTQVETIEVLPGETLWLIAQNYNTTISAIVTLNALTDPETLSIGQQLMIPVGFTAEIVEASAVATEAAETAVVGESESASSVTIDPTVAPQLTDDLARWHTIAVVAVEDGDSLAAIADANTTTVEAIMALNGIADPNMIFVGDALLVAVGYQGDATPVDVSTATYGDTTSSGSEDDMLEGETVSATSTNTDDMLEE